MLFTILVTAIITLVVAVPAGMLLSVFLFAYRYNHPKVLRRVARENNVA